MAPENSDFLGTYIYSHAPDTPKFSFPSISLQNTHSMGYTILPVCKCVVEWLHTVVSCRWQPIHLRHCVSVPFRRQLISALQEPAPKKLGCVRPGACFQGRRRGLVPNSRSGVRHKCDPDFRASWKGGGSWRAGSWVGMMSQEEHFQKPNAPVVFQVAALTIPSSAGRGS